VIDAERVDFIAVPVSDLERADAFYGETLGLARNPNTSGERWVEYETGNLTIALSTFGGGIGIRVPDVDGARSELAGAGVEFGMDTFDSGVCNGAPFVDPDGNRLLLHRRYAPLEPFEAAVGDVQRTDFVGVNVRDRAAAAEFYGGTLGLERNPLSNDDWPEYEAGNVCLITSTPEQKGDERQAFADGYEPEFAIALRVPDVAASMDRLRAGGVEFQFPEVYDAGVCHMAFFADPDGNALILHHRHAPYPDGSQP
jgi:catechol 2,3-dioxygenase-like lactoylglutathione lyase family enzyme